MEKYLIGEAEYTQGYLTIEDTEKVVELLAGLDAKQFATGEPIKIATYLLKQNLLQGLFEIILEGPKPIKDFKKVRLTLALEIIEDFLSSAEISIIISRVLSIGEKMETKTGISTKKNLTTTN